MGTPLRISAVFLAFGCLVATDGLDHKPDLAGRCYVQNGDINLAFLVPVHKSATLGFCSSELEPQGLEMVEAFVYSVRQLNLHPERFSNLSIGFVVVDTCWKDMAALARTLHLVNAGRSSDVKADDNEETCPGLTAKINAMVGPLTSREAVLMSSVASLYDIPVLAVYASSNELSDKTRYRTLMRLVPPDRFQVIALANFLRHYGWTYVSLLFSEGIYGESGAKDFNKQISHHGICIAFSKMLESASTDVDFDNAVVQLMKNMDARLVVLILDPVQIFSLFAAVRRADMLGWFIWAGTDSLGYHYNGRVADGAFIVNFGLNRHPEFESFYYNITPSMISDNPWMKEYMEFYFHCSWGEHEVNNSCQNFNESRLPVENFGVFYSKVVDAVQTFGHGLSSLLTTECETDVPLECVDGQKLMGHLKNVTFQSVNGRVKFDDRGDLLGTYNFLQYVHDARVPYRQVGTWDLENEALDMEESIVNWEVFLPGRKSTKYFRQAPLSVCSLPCDDGQYYVKLDLPCCWECRSCRQNERIVDNYTCEACEIFTMPSRDDPMRCEQVVPSYLNWEGVSGIILLSCATLGLGLSLIITFLYIKAKNNKLIKASARELNSLILLAITLSYCLVYGFVLKPRDLICSVTRVGFHFTVTLIYAPMVIKSNRIYRIFTAGKRGTMAGRVSSAFQLLFACGLLLFQIAVITAALSQGSPQAVLRMPVPTERFVELMCTTPVVGMLVPLLTNLLLLLLCAAHGFLTRKLPENFNESWYIFICVSTTTFLWIVFVPAYFTAFYAIHQTALLASCLLITATVTLVCLFLPKLYAVYLLKEANLNIVTQATTMSVTPASGTSTGRS